MLFMKSLTFKFCCRKDMDNLSHRDLTDRNMLLNNTIV